MITLEAVSRTYARSGREVRALDHVALTIDRGQLLCLTGPSGSGKSTLLHVLGLLDRPTTGTYRWGGEDLSTLDDVGRARVRNGRIGFVFQGFLLIPHLTVLENVELPLVYAERSEWERRRAAEAALVKVGLAERLDHLPGELSGGEQQRVAVARALVVRPELVLADEPTGNLDEAATQAILDLFLECNREGATVVLVTHNPRVAAVGRRVIRMVAGRFASDELRTS